MFQEMSSKWLSHGKPFGVRTIPFVELGKYWKENVLANNLAQPPLSQVVSVLFVVSSVGNLGASFVKEIKE